MLTIVCDAPGRLRAERRARPERAAGEVLVRLRRVGVCGTDLHIFTGDQPYLSYPRVMGHELSGTVEEAPAGSGLSAGDVVSILPYLSCGRCNACRRGLTNCCRDIQVLGVHRDGGMTEMLSLPVEAVRPAPGLDLDQAAMVEFLAIGAHAVRRSRVGRGDRALVVGAGPIGMAAALFADIAGAAVTLLDPRADRLDFCARQLGLTSVVQVGDGDRDALSSITEGDFFDADFDATGNAGAIERGFGFVAHGGTYVLVSIVSGNISFSDPEFHKRETTLLGSRNATPEDFDAVMEAIRAGRVPTAALNTHRLTLSEVPDRFPALLDPSEGVVKAVVHLP
ncbi:zinc-binding alcohol dehydrogenase family protein [Lichenibacterium dinghuense]|uniref:zinc-binding alcohol dehydrogenase family protein n=1 Tax=Lichenibacterium dinghuense TaxID=2895977 RepID=UPI001F2D25F7|nr:zinc-binding alcohol dehydrogenase family protein [Lichenibacterium sp. 6Y81]